MRRDDDSITLPAEKMKKTYSRRRWSDSPTHLRDMCLQPNTKLLITANHDITQSLHDLSEPILKPVSKLSSVSQNNLSTSTIQSEMGIRTKSQDSGFNKSASYLSLHSNSQRFSHVESKVKKYVQDIKDSEALRKKSLSNNHVNHFAVTSSPKKTKPVLRPGENAEDYIEKLELDLRDKDQLFKALQGSYEDLLLKHAEAENKIDQLRLRSLGSSPHWCRRGRLLSSDDVEFQHDYSTEKFLAGSKTPCFSDTSKLSISKEQHDSSCELDGSFSPSVSESILLSPSPQSEKIKLNVKKVHPKEVIISAPLGPIQKLYSTSVRLDQILQPLSQSFPKSDELKLPQPSHGYSSPPQAPAVIESQAEEEDAADGHSEENAGTKSNMYYATADTGTSNNQYHMTTDTGIEDCIQSATDKDTENEVKKIQGRLPIGSELQRIPNFPNEDAFSKVQRWRNSLPNEITDRRLECTTKLKKTRNRKPALPKKNIGVQTNDHSENIPCLCSQASSLCMCNSRKYAPLVKLADSSDNNYAESWDLTDCEDFSDISCKSVKKMWRSCVARTRKDQHFPRSRSVEPENRHRCCGACKTCGRTIVADDSPGFTSSSTFTCTPTERSDECLPRKLRSRVDKSEKIRRESPCLRKAVRLSRVSGSQVTRAVLLDMLLNVQGGHSCCGCCQHSWRPRQLSSPVPKKVPKQVKKPEDSLQQCLAEIQKIAWDLNEKLAQSHAGLVNLSCRKKD